MWGRLTASLLPSLPSEPTGFVWLFPQQAQPLRLAWHVAYRGQKEAAIPAALGLPGQLVPSAALLSWTDGRTDGRTDGLSSELPGWLNSTADWS